MHSYAAAESVDGVLQHNWWKAAAAITIELLPHTVNMSLAPQHCASLKTHDKVQLLACITHDMDVPLSTENLGAPSGVHSRSLRLLGPDVCAAMI
jgi:hypothetical protein